MHKIFTLAGAMGLSLFAHTQDSTAHQLDELMQAWTNQEKFSGTVLVARQGQILLHKGYGFKNRKDSTFNDTHTLYQIASVTKQFTSAVVLKLVEQKKLRLSDKLSRFFPDYPKGDSITIEQLLTHTSGIWDYTRDVELMQAQTRRSARPGEIIGLIKKQPLDFSPGSNWRYSNSGYFLLGAIIEKTTGKPYETVMRQMVFEPLGMKHSAFDFRHLVSTDKAVGYYADSTEAPTKEAPIVDSSVPYAAGAIYATVEDLYRWHQALQQYKVVGKPLMQKAYTPYKNNYGYGWIIDSLYGRRMVSHSGGIFGFRTNLARVPEDDVCVILLSNMETESREPITRNLLAIVYNKPYTLPVRLQAVPLPDSIRKRYTGTYKIEANGVLVEVALEGARLMARPHNGPPSELLALDETHFFLANEHEFRIYFELDEMGKVLRMMVNPNGTAKPAPKIK
jgi:CubicO group peptidase (beta-lactamase class C family)